jgi:dipeptidyl aminopeptidase/acylaminoacyl peptidase
MKRILFVVSLAIALAAPAAAQPRPMSIVDMINLQRLSGPQLSPDGKQILYVISEADWKLNRRVSHLHRLDRATGASVQMTNGPEGETLPRWSPDGKRFSFVAKRGGDEAAQIYVMSNAGGEALAVTKHETAASAVEWAKDGSALYYLAPEPKSADEKAKEKIKDDVFAFDEDFKQTHLWKVTLEGGKAARLTSGDFTVAAYRLSPDGKKLVFRRAPNPLYGDAEKAEIWTMNADGSGANQVTDNKVVEGSVSFSPDGATILYTSGTLDGTGTYYNDKVFVVPAAGGTPKRLTPDDVTFEANEAEFSRDGQAIYIHANVGVSSQIFEMPVGGGPARALTSGDHSIGGWEISPTGEHVMVLDTGKNPGEIFVGSVSAPARGASRGARTSAPPAPSAFSLAQVSKLHDGLEKRFAIPRTEKITWKGADGVLVEGLLTYPIGFSSDRRAPLLVVTHGGPAASDKFGFGAGTSAYLPVMAAQGYAVLRPNYRGSTGYGDPFLRDMVGSYFANSHLDVMTGTDAVIAMGVADPDRLIKMGWSGGGHMTNKIITFTNRFKAASSGAGAANWISMYAQSDVRTYRTPWFGGTPWQKDAPIDVYWANSPLKDIANVKTPTLFLVGEKDVRVPPPQSVEMHRGLKANGVPTRLYMAPREPHGWNELRHQLFKINVELEWFDKYALKRGYAWEKAPESGS